MPAKRSSACERWKKIPFFRGYEVSNRGRVRSWRLAVDGKPKLLKLSGAPYLRVALRCGKRTVFRQVHRLVAQLFVDKADSAQTSVNHINGDKRDNRSENLEWVTPAENTKHAWRTGLMRKKG